LGPSVLHIIQPDVHLGQVGAVLSTITLIVILYEGGLHLRARDLVESSLSALLLSLLSFLTITAMTTLVLLPVLPLLSAILVGVGIGSTSSAIVIPMVRPLPLHKNTKIMLSLESAFTDVLTIVIFLGLLEYMTSETTSGSQFLINLGSTPILSICIGCVSGIIWSFVSKTTHVSKLPFAGEAGALLTYGLLESWSLNGAIGVLALGFTLANINILPRFLRCFLDDRSVSVEMMSLLSAVTLLLRTFFFVYLGLLIRIQSWSMILWAIILTKLIFITRYLSIRVVFHQRTVSKLDAMIATAMGPRGLACAVLATLPLQRGIQNGHWIQNLIFTIIPLSILMTSICISLSESRWFRVIMDRLFKRYPENEDLTTPSSSMMKEEHQH